MVNRFRHTPPERRLVETLRAAQRSTRDVQRPTGTEKNRSLLKLQEALAQLAEQQSKLQEALAQLAEQQSKLQEQQAQLTALVNAIPVARAAEAVGAAFTPTVNWQTVATVNITRPDGKATAAVMALASVVVNWAVSGAAAWPVVSARVVMNGVAGPAVPLGQGINAATTSVSGRASGSAMRAGTVTGSGPVQVQVQVAITGWIGDGPAGAASWSGGSPQIAANVTFSE